MKFGNIDISHRIPRERTALSTYDHAFSVAKEIALAELGHLKDGRARNRHQRKLEALRKKHGEMYWTILGALDAARWYL